MVEVFFDWVVGRCSICMGCKSSTFFNQFNAAGWLCRADSKGR